MTRLLLALLAASALAGCKLGESEKASPVSGSCSPVGNACGRHADCCSYGCQMGVCVANPDAGGACRTSNDCDWTLYCLSGACTPVGAGTCHQPGDVCDYNNECCSGNCVGDNQSTWPPTAGACQVNTAPVVDLGGDREVPYFVTATLTATVTDPDADTLVYGWTLVSAPQGSGLAGWTSNVRSPSFTPLVPGVYAFNLAVTDGPSTQRGRLTATAGVTLTAVDQPPVVAAGADVAAQLRNVALAVAGTVSDPNGAASPVSCAWYATPPGSSEALQQSWTTCPASPGFTFTPPLAGPEGDWVLRLEASDGTFTVSDTRVVTVVNGAPTASAGPDRVGNLGPTPGTAPAVPLAGSATDPNGDVGAGGFTFTWTVSAVNAPGSAFTPGAPVGSGASASFVPDAMGTYTLQLHVDDGWGGTHDDLVTVTAERHLRPLAVPGTIADAAYVKGTERIVMVGTDLSSGTAVHRLWVLDPASQAAPTAIGLGAQPVCLSLSPDGTEALVGEVGAKWQRITGLGSTPSPSALLNGPFTPNAVVHAGARWYAFGTSGAVYELLNDGTTTPYTPAPCWGGCTFAATRAVGTTDTLWMIDEAADTLSRWIVRPNGDLERNPATVLTGLVGLDRLWRSANGQDLVLGDGSVRVASTLASAAALPFSPAHFDSSFVSSVLQGVAVPAAGAPLTTLDAGYAATGTLVVPQLGVSGTGYPGTARFVFVRADGTAHYAIVRAIVSASDRWFLATY
jgi:hypothetical protein